MVRRAVELLFVYEGGVVKLGRWVVGGSGEGLGW